MSRVRTRGRAAARGAGAARGASAHAGAWHARPALAAIVPALAALALHLQALAFGFVRDDFPVIVDSVWMRGSGTLGRLLASDFMTPAGLASGLWRPLVLLSFWVEGRLGGWTPRLFHATNIALHAGTTLLLGLLLLQAGLPRAAVLAGGLLFAAMPAHVESVAWVLGRTDLMCGGFALLALWLDRRARERGRAWPGVLAVAAVAAALLSKEAAAGWVAVIAAAEWVRARTTPTPWAESARWLAPYAALTALWLVAHAWAVGPATLPPYIDAALRARRQAAGWVMLPQFVAFLWPWYPQSSDLAIWIPTRTLAWPVVAGAAITLAAGAGVSALAWRRSPWLVPAAIALVTVLPSLAMALARGYITSGARMVYTASAGVAWLAALALARALRAGPAWRWAALGALAVFVLGGAVELLRVQPSWADEARVFETMARRQPDNPIAWIGLAGVLGERGRAQEGLAALARADSLAPRLPAVAIGRAHFRYDRGEWAAVIAETDRALALDEGAFDARLLRASALIRLGRMDEAARDLERLLRARPDHPAALMLEGQRLLTAGRFAEAVTPLATAARATPRDTSVWFALAYAHAETHDLRDARQDLERALALAPGRGPAWAWLAQLCAALGDSAAARAARDRARALGGPASPSAAPDGAPR